MEYEARQRRAVCLTETVLQLVERFWQVEDQPIQQLVKLLGVIPWAPSARGTP